MIVTSSLTGGGAERSMNLLANELLRRGWDVSLVPINSSEPDLIEPKCELFLLNRRWQSGLFGTIKSIVAFNRIAITWKPEIVILNCALPEMFGSMMLVHSSIIVLEHAKLPWVGRESLGRSVRRILKLRGARWVAVSSHLKIWPSKNLPSAILQNSISSLEMELNDNSTFSDIKRLVFIGRLSAEKRPDWILDISSKSGIPAIFIGDGRLRSELEGKLNSSNSSVEFQGFVRNPWNWLTLGDLLIVPSEWEGDGLVIIEALRANVPMLLADIPDFRRFLFPNHHYAADCDAFVQSIGVNARDLNSLRIPAEIRLRILFERTPVNVGSQWENYLRKLD
jgi:glycosyltransferase involved in cell wall biosynthesis